MPSIINPNNINGTFPVAGQDNSSQGFRDNFRNIKNNFVAAQAEISDLQNKAVLTSALNGQTLNNNMAGTILSGAQLRGWTESVVDLGIVSSVASLDFSAGNFQKFTTGNSLGLSFLNWPNTFGTNAVGYGIMRVWIYVTNIAHTVTLPNSVDKAVLDIAGYNSNTHAITFNETGNYIFEFSSIDGGISFAINDITRNRVSFKDPNLYFTDLPVGDQTNSTLFVGFGGNGVGAATTIESGIVGHDSVSAQGGYNAVGVGILSQANVVTYLMDTGSIAGYSVTAARGNLQTGTIQPVQNGDIVGYYNAVGYTGYSAVGNSFQQLSSIVHYASGTNYNYGLGGNIAFYTADDGASASGVVYQAMSINNDQSVQVMGPFRTDSGISERGTYLVTMAQVSPVAFTANYTISTVVIDSVNSGDIGATPTVILPNPATIPDRFKLRIVGLPKMASANIYPTGGTVIKWLPGGATTTTYFSAGNVALNLIYYSGTSTWYKI